MKPKPLDPERLAKVTQDAHQLGKLKEQPGWTLLTRIFERDENKYFDEQFRKLRRGEEVDQTDVRVHQLAFDIVKHLLANPEKAETTLSRALERAERLGAIREEVTL